MREDQQQKIVALVDKYNDVLLHSMRLAIAEDLINLMLLNRDDREFELKDLLQDKDVFYQFILKEFLKKNSSSVVNELRSMEDPTAHLKKKVRSNKAKNSLKEG